MVGCGSFLQGMKSKFRRQGQDLFRGRERTGAQLVHHILGLHATVHASCPQSRELSRGGHCHAPQHHCCGRRVLYLQRASLTPVYELQFNTAPWEVRDCHLPPHLPLDNQVNSFLKMPAHRDSCRELEPLGFPGCSFVCSAGCPSWSLETPRHRSEKKNTVCSHAESGRKYLPC